MAKENIEISVRGMWTIVPALSCSDHHLVVRGGWVKIAVVHDEAWLESEVEDPEAYANELKQQGADGLRADIFTFSQKPSSSVAKHRYYSEMDSIAIVRLSTFKEWWEKLPQEARKNVRRSEKRGVVVEIKPFNDDLVRSIVSVNNESAVRQKTPNVHYGKTCEQTKKDHSAFLDRSEFIGAYSENRMIGYAKIVYRGEVASILNFVPMVSESDKRPANALMAKIVAQCETKGVSHLMYGFYNYGNKRGDSLREFKIRNGFEELLVPRYYIPLTVWGKLCLKMRLHRGVVGILPHKVISILLDLRSKWYDIRSTIVLRGANKPV